MKMNKTATFIDTVKKRIDRHFPTIVFLLISLLIWLSLDKNYILLLDMIFPKKNWLEYFYFLYPSPTIGSVSTSWVMERIYLSFAMFLSGYSMYSLSYKISPLRIAGFYASLLYMINPLIYIRIMVGHLNLLLSYAALPLLLIIFINFLEKKENKEMIKFIFLLSFVSISLHIVIIAIIMMSILFLFWFNKHRDIRISKIILLSAVLFILLNSYWIIPLMTPRKLIVDYITEKDFEAYAPKGTLFDLAAMYGFWREGYLYTKDFLPGWQILYLIILSLAILGFIFYYKDDKIGIYVKAFAVIGILGFILASGVNGPFGDIVRWLFENTILKGFRDSQKFVAMMVLAYSVLGGLGLNKIKSMYDKYNEL